MNVAGANSALGEGCGAPESRFGGLTSAEARAKNRPPIAATKRNCGQTTSMPAPRYRIDWANETKCVDGDAYIAVASHGGRLSSGALLPDSMSISM